MMKSINNALNNKWKITIGTILVSLVLISPFIMLKFAHASDQTDYYLDRSRTEVNYNWPERDPLTEKFKDGKDYVTNVKLFMYPRGDRIRVEYKSDSWCSVTATFKVNASINGVDVARFSVKTKNYIDGPQEQRIEPGDLQDVYNGYTWDDAKKLPLNSMWCHWYIDKIIVWD